MFERYTEKARRTVFYARYEASQFGSPYIETEHLLLGLLRENKALTNLFLGAHQPVEEIRRKIEARTVRNEPTSTSVDLPLSNEGKRTMAYAAEEAERLGTSTSAANIFFWVYCAKSAALLRQSCANMESRSSMHASWFCKFLLMIRATLWEALVPDGLE